LYWVPPGRAVVVMVSGDGFTVMDRASLAVWDDGVE
jgi:hypothetical protein